jgi:hypothetical protein
MATKKSANRYTQLIEAVFLSRYQEGMSDVVFDRVEIRVTSEKHYRLVQPDDLSSNELALYRNRLA